MKKKLRNFARKKSNQKRTEWGENKKEEINWILHLSTGAWKIERKLFFLVLVIGLGELTSSLMDGKLAGLG